MYVKFWRPGGKALWQGCKVLRQDRKIAMVITLVAISCQFGNETKMSKFIHT